MIRPGSAIDQRSCVSDLRRGINESRCKSEAEEEVRLSCAGGVFEFIQKTIQLTLSSRGCFLVSVLIEIGVVQIIRNREELVYVS